MDKFLLKVFKAREDTKWWMFWNPCSDAVGGFFSVVFLYALTGVTYILCGFQEILYTIPIVAIFAIAYVPFCVIGTIKAGKLRAGM